jgi:hypothetical protein
MTTETLATSEKQLAMEALQRMPDSASLQQISEEMALLAAGRQAEFDAGRAMPPTENGKKSNPAWPFEPRDEWERQLLELAQDCGVSLPNSAVSSEGIYE